MPRVMTGRVSTKFQSTRSSRSGTKHGQRDPAEHHEISIHPLLAERDAGPAGPEVARLPHFNPPAPRGAGPADADGDVAGIGISIHPLLAERDGQIVGAVDDALISIHPLLAERDHDGQRGLCRAHISIHPLLAERDP